MIHSFTDIFGIEYEEVPFVKDVQFTEDGEPMEIYYFYTTAKVAEDCDFCNTGTCIQKIVSGLGWESVLVIHEQAKKLS